MPLKETLQQISISITKPFGPFIASARISKESLSDLVESTDRVLLNPDRQSYGQNLAGVIKEEPILYKKDLIGVDLNDLLKPYILTYIKESAKRHGRFNDEVNITTSILEAWIVSQYKNEYNPLHNHAGCQISGVLYLKVPNMKKRRKIESKKGSIDQDGNIQLTYSAGDRDTDIFEKGSISIAPEEGLLILFPSFLYHSVYPFVGEGERRSIAFNSTYQMLLNNSNGSRFLAGNRSNTKRLNLYG